jgi:TolB-like protein/Flp pilus assembly protein TadD
VSSNDRTRLDSWKEIAEYLGRDVRTVIRWEKERGLPIHRVPGAKGGVFASREEIDAWLHGGPRPPAGPPRIAVLPFLNILEPSQDYVPQGMTENIIASLSRVPRVRVMAWSTVGRFRGPAADPRQVGQELKVNAVVTGRVAQRNGFWQVNVEIVDPSDGAQLWGKQFTKPALDLQTLPDRIAREILDGIEVRLNPQESQRLVPKLQVKPEAYDLYLRARYYFSEIAEGSFLRAIESLEKAIAIQPDYAQAYAELAQCYTFLAIGYGDLPHRELLAKADVAARKAVELDDSLGEAHCALAVASVYHGWDWAFVEKEFKRAIELNPSYANAHGLYGTLLLALGRMDEALAEDLWANEVDPFSPLFSGDYAFHLTLAGRHDEALDHIRRVMQANPGVHLHKYILGVVHERMGRYTEAIEALEQSVAVGPAHTQPLGVLGYVYAVSGQREKAFGVLRRLEELAKTRPVSHFTKAFVFAGLADRESALASLEKAYEEGSAWLYMLKAYPWLASLHNEPRFQELVRRVGLPF